MAQHMEPSFSILTMSIASSAAMALGLAPHPESGKTHKDKNLAKFNIDLIVMLKEKTKGNLTNDETVFIDSVISDLQIKFVHDRENS